MSCIPPPDAPLTACLVSSAVTLTATEIIPLMSTRRLLTTLQLTLSV